MNCPRCSCHSEVVRTTRVGSGAAVRRERRCVSPKCRHRWRTLETDEGQQMVCIARGSRR